ncbi:MAG: fibronectin type III domain-containing protein [Fimbriimonadaceae bacterium]
MELNRLDMASKRIKRTPSELRDQLLQAAAAITALGPAWPTSAPTAAQLTARANAIGDSIDALHELDAATKTERQTRDRETSAGQNEMRLVDGYTSGLFGPGGAQKASFALTPILPGSRLPAPPQISNLRIRDGQFPTSLLCGCEAVTGASYEWEWYASALLTTLLGKITTTRSEHLITDLDIGTRYWVRVRAVRGSQYGMWSDADSRVANV